MIYGLFTKDLRKISFCYIMINGLFSKWGFTKDFDGLLIKIYGLIASKDYNRLIFS